jgi:hypothetical protein
MTQIFKKDNRDGKPAIAIFGSVFTLLVLYISGLWFAEPLLASGIFAVFFIGGWIQLAFCYVWPIVWTVSLDHDSLSYLRNGALVERVNRSEVSEITFDRLNGWMPGNFEDYPTIKLTLKGGGVHVVSYWRLCWKNRKDLLLAFSYLWGESMLQPEINKALSVHDRG